jgi:hypothetical protein
MDRVETTMRGAAALGRRVKPGTAPMPRDHRVPDPGPERGDDRDGEQDLRRPSFG